MQLFAESRDQGIVYDKKFGNWTWFEIAILTDNEPKAKDGIKLAWVSHENRIKTTEFGWVGIVEAQAFLESNKLIN